MSDKKFAGLLKKKLKNRTCVFKKYVYLRVKNVLKGSKKLEK